MSTAASNPRATVVITTHNRAEYARRAVSSALAQSLGVVEVVLVDDGSVPRFSTDQDDRRLRVIRRDEPGGMCAARNEGLAVARGEWVIFLDDDDELAPDMLELALAAAARSSLPAPVAVMAAMAIVGADGTEIERCHPPTLRRGEHFFMERRGDPRAKNALVIPTSVARAIGGWDEQFEAFEADDFGLRLNLAASILGLDEPLYRMTHHGAPRLQTRWAAIPRDMQRTLAKHRDAFRQHRGVHAHYMSTIGMYELKAGHWGSALRWCLRGVGRDPRRARHWRFLAAAVAGPHTRAAYRRVRAREAGVSIWTLTRRRVRKYAKRLANYPRALIGVPLAWATSVMLRRGRRAVIAHGSRYVLVLCVYRARNAPYVGAFVDESLTHDWAVRLWALDRVDQGLAMHTIGVSAGAKFPMLNELVRGQDLDRFDWIVVADDDFVFRTGSIDEVLAVAEAAGLDLVQPAHTELSHWGHEIAVRRPLAVARCTTYVEIGPMFAVRQPWTDRILPFPSDHAMGWGLELEWFDLIAEGARLGIVDATPIRHLHPVGKGYANDEEGERLRALVRARGLASFQDIQRTIETWRPWQARPPWSRPDDPRVST